MHPSELGACRGLLDPRATDIIAAYQLCLSSYLVRSAPLQHYWRNFRVYLGIGEPDISSQALEALSSPRLISVLLL
jgi:hypothetical protein